MEIRRRMLLQGALPPKYQRVEYLQTDAYRSYFDTGVAGNDNTLQFDIVYTVDNGGSYGAVVSSYDNVRSHNAWCLRDYNNSRTQDYMLNCNNLDAGGHAYTVFKPDTIVGKIIHARMEYGSIVFIVDGVVYSQTIPEMAADTSTENIFVGNYPVPVSYGSSHSFYSLKITKDSKLIRNYIPCYRKSDNKAGFYDLVNHTFNPSIGASDFIIPS